MKYAILSDAHANIDALKAVVEDIKTQSVQKIIFLGDVVGYGAEPLKTMQFIEKFCDRTIAGNHDHIISTIKDMENINNKPISPLRWTKSVLDHQDIEKLSNLPFEYSGDGFHCVHSSPHNPKEWNYILTADDAKKGFAANNKKIIFVGHSHVPVIFVEVEYKRFFAGEMRRVKTIHDKTITISDNYRYIINVGSVGQPRDGDPRAAYGIYDSETKTYSLQRILYDVNKASDRIIKAGLPKELAERLKVGR